MPRVLAGSSPHLLLYDQAPVVWPWRVVASLALAPFFGLASIGRNANRFYVLSLNTDAFSFFTKASGSARHDGVAIPCIRHRVEARGHLRTILGSLTLLDHRGCPN